MKQTLCSQLPKIIGVALGLLSIGVFAWKFRQTELCRPWVMLPLGIGVGYVVYSHVPPEIPAKIDRRNEQCHFQGTPTGRLPRARTMASMFHSAGIQVSWLSDRWRNGPPVTALYLTSLSESCIWNFINHSRYRVTHIMWYIPEGDASDDCLYHSWILGLV